MHNLIQTVDFIRKENIIKVVIENQLLKRKIIYHFKNKLMVKNRLKSIKRSLRI
jgi:hypothetical protein